MIQAAGIEHAFRFLNEKAVGVWMKGGFVTGKSARSPAFLPVGRGGAESRLCKRVHISRKPPPSGRGASLLKSDARFQLYLLELLITNYFIHTFSGFF